MRIVVKSGFGLSVFVQNFLMENLHLRKTDLMHGYL